MSSSTNPGISIKCELVRRGLTIKDLAQTANHSYGSLTHQLKKGTVPEDIALALEKLGIGTALEWVKESASYRLHLHNQKTSSTKS